MKSGNLNFLEPSGPLQACNGSAFTWAGQVSQDMLANAGVLCFISAVPSETKKRHHIVAQLIIRWNSVSHCIISDHTVSYRAILCTLSYHGLHHTLSYHDILQRIVSHHIILWHTTSYSIIPWHTSYTIIHHNTVASYIVLSPYHTVAAYIALYPTESYSIIPWKINMPYHTSYCIILLHPISYCVTPYNIMASYILLYSTESYSIIQWHTIL